MLCAVLGLAACADDGVIVETERGSTTVASIPATETQAGSVGEMGSVPVGWPNDWYGEYYEDPGLTLGLEYPNEVVTWRGFRNMRLGDRRVTLELFNRDVDSEESARDFSTERDGDALRVIFSGGEWDVLYPGAEQVLIRPGATCNEAVLEAYGLSPPYDPVFSTRWWRGRLCVIDSYDGSITDDKWMVDLCPGSVSSCDDG